MLIRVVCMVRVMSCRRFIFIWNTTHYPLPYSYKTFNTDTCVMYLLDEHQHLWCMGRRVLPPTIGEV